MGLLDLFRNGRKQELSHIRNLIAVALADGKLEDAEIQAIMAVCTRENISEDVVKQCIANPSSIRFVAPKSDVERIKCLRDMVFVMMADGRIDDKEVVFCKLAAMKLGFAHEVVDAIVMQTIEELIEELKK